MKINSRLIGEKYLPYVIAEMSANHNGKIENAYKIIEMAKRSGADAVKLQTYRPDTITMDMNTPEFMIEGGLWHGQSLYELYEGAYTPWDWHKPLFDYAKKLDLTIFSSPFDTTAVDLLEDLNAPAYKIASFEAVDLPLIQYVAQTGKPMIISTGMANAEEIAEAIQAAQDGGAHWLTVHARTKEEAYRPPAHWEYIARMKDAISIPVIANGDIWSKEDYKRCIEVSGCQDVMMGRGLIAKPDLALQAKENATLQSRIEKLELLVNGLMDQE